MTDTPTASRLPRPLVLALLVLGAGLSMAVVPGVFTVDDNNYLVNVLALRQGHVAVANTAGLTPSRELLFFDPTARSRVVNVTPVTSTAPPLYAPLALPFSWFGWRGLVALNTLAYLATIAMVFWYAQRYSTNTATAWLAAGAFAFGGYAIEYAVGLWPQALSFALCTAGIIAAGRVIEDGRVSLAMVSGFLLALAAGVRYQNTVILASVGTAIAVWTWRRPLITAAFGLAAALPLAASATINHFRFDSWNPISKGPGYLSIPLGDSARSVLLDPLVMFWAQVVDYSTRPPLTGRDIENWLHYDPTTGAHVLLSVALKKALLQSTPWAILALLLFAVVWTPRGHMPASRRRQVRLLSIVTGAVLLTFALAGANHHDGLSFNARYLLELLPLLAVTCAWALDRQQLQPRPLVVGAVVGVAVVMAILLGTPSVGGPEMPLWLLRQRALMKLPLLLAAGVAVLWAFAMAGYRVRSLLGAAVGACLAWGLMLHLGSDVITSQMVRVAQRARTEALRGVLTDQSALVAYWGYKEAAGPLLLDGDIVVLETQADEGQDAPVLIRELLARNRKVFLLEDGFPPGVLSTVARGLRVVPIARPGVRLVELRAE